MTEEEAQTWLASHGWWDGLAGDRLRRFVELVLEEADQQNLISASSRDQIWSRHIVDSAQLLPLALASIEPEVSAITAAAVTAGQEDEAGQWVDMGTGAGFPGIVIACLRDAPIQLVEMRPLRVAFLERCAVELELTHVTVIPGKVEKVELDRPAQFISARAFAPLDRLLASAYHLSDENTLWLLPKGRNGEKELEIIRADWQAVFHVEQSVTDPESVIMTMRKMHKRQRQRQDRGHGRGPVPGSSAAYSKVSRNSASRKGPRRP